MENQPLVSILMTSYNREKYIAEAIESVLSSTYSNFELIIVDDCSNDRTVEIAKGYEAKDERVKVFINEKNLGDYPNRNKAASYAKGKYIKFLDSDDIIYPHGLEVMVRSMEKYPNAGFGVSSKPDHDRFYPVCIEPKEIFKEHFGSFSHFGRAPGSTIYKRSVFENEKGFSGERMVGDMELMIRLSMHYPMVKFPHELYWVRSHSGQEVKSDYAKKVYPIRVKQLIGNALDNRDCPLSKQEIKKIKKKIIYSRWKSKIRKILRPFRMI